ncbi:MAG: hypothetical protein ACRELC_13630, partial [Gemmatimonadota bacterium]
MGTCVLDERADADLVVDAVLAPGGGAAILDGVRPPWRDAFRDTHVLLFVAGCIGIYATSWYVLSLPTDRHALEIGVTLDLTVFVPVLYWLVLVRGRGWPLASVLPVFLASLLLASFMLPAGRHGTLDVIKYLAAAAELALVGVLVHRTARAIRYGRATRNGDALERARSAVRDALGDSRAADVIAFEAAMLWYALFSWRMRSRAAAEPRSFTYHEKTGYGALVVALLLGIAVEVIAIHALLARWSVSVAWIATALSLYGILWIIGDLRAVQLRPIVLEADRLVVRFGLRWSLDVPLRQIEAVRLIGGSVVQDRVDLRMALPGSRRVSILLETPVVASGIY